MWSIPTRPAGGTFQDRKAVHSAGARSLPARPAGGSPQDEWFTRRGRGLFRLAQLGVVHRMSGSLGGSRSIPARHAGGTFQDR